MKEGCQEAKRYSQECEQILAPRWLNMVLIGSLAFASQFSVDMINYYFAAQLRIEMWLDVVKQPDSFVALNRVYYFVINATLMFFIMDTVYRWLKFWVLSHRLYEAGNSGKFGSVNMALWFLAPSESNPLYKVGDYLISLAWAALFIGVNFFTFYAAVGALPTPIRIISFVAFIVPSVFVFMPVEPIKKKLKTKYDELDNEERNQFITAISSTGKSALSELAVYCDRLAKLNQISLSPVRLHNGTKTFLLKIMIPVPYVLSLMGIITSLIN